MRIESRYVKGTCSGHARISRLPAHVHHNAHLCECVHKCAPPFPCVCACGVCSCVRTRVRTYARLKHERSSASCLLVASSRLYENAPQL